MKFLPTYHTMKFRSATDHGDAFRQGVRYALEHRDQINLPCHSVCFEAGMIAAMVGKPAASEESH